MLLLEVFDSSPRSAEIRSLDDFRGPFEAAQSSPTALGGVAELVDHGEHRVAGQTSIGAVGPMPHPGEARLDDLESRRSAPGTSIWDPLSETFIGHASTRCLWGKQRIVTMRRYRTNALNSGGRALSRVKDATILIRSKLRRMTGVKDMPNDLRWFDLQFRPDEALKQFGIPLPSLPPDEVQRRFTGLHGRENLKQAFNFYSFARSVSKLEQINEPRILDFGGGWGRIARLFLRDTSPQHIWIADCLGDAIHWLHETQNPSNIIKNETYPPIAQLNTGFDLVYAFSVFSHLSEEYALAWLDYLFERLSPDGHLVFTTRGEAFMANHERMHETGASPTSYALLDKLPRPEQLRARYLKGEFQFYPTGGGDELTPDFYGETLIPRSYIEKRYRSSLVDFTEEVKDADQAVFVLRR